MAYQRKTSKRVAKPKRLTDREKKAILESKTFCARCSDNTLAVAVNDKGQPLCRTHGG